MNKLASEDSQEKVKEGVIGPAGSIDQETDDKDITEAAITASTSSSAQKPPATAVVATSVKSKKAQQHQLNRSDSTGSSSGRKFLAPTLSDPQARSDKERYSTKKKSNRQQSTKNLADLNHLNHYNHHIMQHHHEMQHQQKFIMPTAACNAQHQHINMVEVHDWWQEICTSTASDDES
jgi:sodium leak channel non-selective protein